MELKEYLKIFKKKSNLFISVVMGVLLLGILLQVILPTRYKAEVNLDITRTGQQKETTDYRYDEFYRLQADERFADTVVRWLGSERIQEDIILATNKSYFSKLRASRLSSQLIEMTFLVLNPKEADRIASAVSEVLNKKSQELNKDQQNKNWFKIIVSDPVVREYKLSIFKLVSILTLLGFFLGFWVVLIKHYLEE